MIKKYITKPCEVLALEWNGENFEDIRLFTNYNANMTLVTSGKEELVINTTEGQTMAIIGDYIIKGLKDDYHICKPDIFNKKYEEVI